jgi:hypothetical protein
MSTDLGSAKQPQFQSLLDQLDYQLGLLSENIDTFKIKMGVLGCDNSEKEPEPKPHEKVPDLTIINELKDKITMLEILNHRLSNIKKDLIDLVG